MHGFDGLYLFFEDRCGYEVMYVAKIGRVHTPRFQQIVTLKDWHLSRTLSQRIVKTPPNNLSNLAAILALLRGGAQAIRLGEEASKVVFSR